MTMIEMLAAYGIFIVSGAITMMFIIYIPAVQIVRRVEPNHPLMWPFATVFGGVGMFILFLLSGPMMLFVLARRDTFLENFIKGLLNDS